jgi:uncharacterized protein (TIGR00369 family)
VAAVSEPIPDGFRVGVDRLYGLEILELSDARARAEVKVRDDLKQPSGVVHGGIYAAIAESLALFGTARGAMADGEITRGLSHQMSLLRPITEGSIHAVAVPKHRGRTTWVWEVEMTDDNGNLCVLTRITIAVRER